MIMTSEDFFISGAAANTYIPNAGFVTVTIYASVLLQLRTLITVVGQTQASQNKSGYSC